MAEYKLANGSVLTDADIELICKELEGESWAGRLERIHRGPAAVGETGIEGTPPSPAGNGSVRRAGRPTAAI